MAHTKGPWRYEESTKTIRSYPANYWLASMDSWDGAVDHAANAKVIAAAPDLLHALLCLVEWVEDHAVKPSEISEVINARAVIAKAEERS